MKDVLKIIRFDFLTAKPIVLGGMVFTVLMFGSLSLFFSPIMCAWIMGSAIMFVLPLQEVADKNGFNKLYGTLPVKRRNVTRGRFLYVYLVHFLTEQLELVIIMIAKTIRLYRILPNQDGATMQLVKESFADTNLMLAVVFGTFVLFSLVFSYMEMMGQVHGRENEFKILMITLGILTVIIVTFTILLNRELIPMISLPGLPESVGGMLAFGAVLNAVMLLVCLFFGEVTAGRLAKREL